MDNMIVCAPDAMRLMGDTPINSVVNFDVDVAARRCDPIRTPFAGRSSVPGPMLLSIDGRRSASARGAGTAAFAGRLGALAAIALTSGTVA
jgi:hypothetical protein